MAIATLAAATVVQGFGVVPPVAVNHPPSYITSSRSSSSSRNPNSSITRSVLSVTMSPSGVDDILMDDDDDEEEEAPDFLISSSADLDGIEDDYDIDIAAAGEFEAPPGFEFALKLAEVREQYRRHETDTGSPEYVVASMTERISYLTGHLKQHPKDFSTRRGLVALVNKRRRTLNYLFEEDVERYVSLVASLGIRHKAPGRVVSRAEKYVKFATKKKSKTRDSL